MNTNFSTAFQNMLQDITVQRQTVIDSEAARKEFTTQILTIQGVILPVTDKNNGSTALNVTKDHGTYNLGDITIYVEEDLQVGSDVILFDDKQYGVLTKLKYTSIIPHNRYIASGNI